ncbi:MAG TPA: insulinase family protein, partial [Flavobacterium sp.]|nr:insulinase family protein [Flavobacterium sp.]
ALVNVTNLKMTDKDYYAALLANEVLGGGGTGSYLNMNLREAHGWTYGAYSRLRGDKYVGKFKASAQVRNAVTDSAVVEMLKELKKIRTEKVTDKILKNAKATYIGNFVRNVQKPETIARFALQAKTQGLPDDFYENYIKNINAVTADDIQRVASKYFLADNVRIMVTGKGSEVLPGLQKLGIPIFYFDKFGNPIDKNAAKKEIPAGVTAKTVFDSYIKAVGGDKNVKSVKSLFTTMTGNVQGIAVTAVSKSTSQGKKLDELTGMGQTLSKDVFDGTKGYESAQGQKKDYDAAKINEAKFYAAPFPELALASKPGVVLGGIESIDGKEAYAVKDDKKTLYYDVATGLKIAESNVEEVQGQQMTQMIIYSDYRDVKGIKVPFKTVLNVGIEIELKTTDVKVNEGVTDADFKI